MSVLTSAIVNGDTPRILLTLGGALLAVAFLLGAFWPRAYQFHADTFVVREGRLRTRIPYAAICRLRPDDNTPANAGTP